MSYIVKSNLSHLSGSLERCLPGSKFHQDKWGLFPCKYVEDTYVGLPMIQTNLMLQYLHIYSGLRFFEVSGPYF